MPACYQVCVPIELVLFTTNQNQICRRRHYSTQRVVLSYREAKCSVTLYSPNIELLKAKRDLVVAVDLVVTLAAIGKRGSPPRSTFLYPYLVPSAIQGI